MKRRKANWLGFEKYWLEAYMKWKITETRTPAVISLKETGCTEWQEMPMTQLNGCKFLNSETWSTPDAELNI